MPVRSSAALLLLILVVPVAALGTDFGDLVAASSPDSRVGRRGLTQAEIKTVAEAIANNDPLSARQQFVVDRFTKMLRNGLSAAALEALDALQATVYAVHEPGSTVNDLAQAINGEVDTEQLVSESIAIYSTLPVGKPVGGTRIATDGDSPTPNFALFWPFVGGVVLCDLAVNACLRDVEQEWEDCMMGVLCSERKLPSPICCDQKAQNDIFNCVISCGGNRADDDYGRCCVRR